jgi:hypothetical protein
LPFVGLATSLNWLHGHLSFLAAAGHDLKSKVAEARWDSLLSRSESTWRVGGWFFSVGITAAIPFALGKGAAPPKSPLN